MRLYVLLLILACGIAQSKAAVVASDTSDKYVICTDCSDSIIWKTVMNYPFTVPIEWPENAEKGQLTISDGIHEDTTVEISSRETTECVIRKEKPVVENQESVLSLSLKWFDVNGVELGRLGKSTTIGIVRSTGGGGVIDARVVFADPESRKWKKTGNNAVIQIPQGSDELTINGKTFDTASSPEWRSLNLGNGSVAELSLSSGGNAIVRTVITSGKSVVVVIK